MAQFITDGKYLRGQMPEILKKAQDALLGKTVKTVGYAVESDGEAFPCIEFNDGTLLIIQRDDECNGPGAGSIVRNGKQVAFLCETAGK